MRRAVFGLLLTLVLTACPGYLDGYSIKPLSITVDKSQAVVEEPVTVTLTGGFVNVALTRSPDYIVPNFRLGACFGRTTAQPYVTRGGLCLDKDLPLPSYIVITEGQSYQKAFGEQVIRNGGEVTLKHTFSFTSTEPGPVSISAMSQTAYGNTTSPAFENSLDVQVQFK